MGLALAGMTFVACDKDDEKNEKIEGGLKRCELITKDTTAVSFVEDLINPGDTICEFSFNKETQEGTLKFQRVTAIGLPSDKYEGEIIVNGDSVLMYARKTPSNTNAKSHLLKYDFEFNLQGLSEKKYNFAFFFDGEARYIDVDLSQETKKAEVTNRGDLFIVDYFPE